MEKREDQNTVVAIVLIVIGIVFSAIIQNIIPFLICFGISAFIYMRDQ